MGEGIQGWISPDGQVFASSSKIEHHKVVEELAEDDRFKSLVSKLWLKGVRARDRTEMLLDNGWVRWSCPSGIGISVMFVQFRYPGVEVHVRKLLRDYHKLYPELVIEYRNAKGDVGVWRGRTQHYISLGLEGLRGREGWLNGEVTVPRIELASKSSGRFRIPKERKR